MRRISTGVQGRPILGNFVAETNRFITRETNQDIVLQPDGAGVISAESHVRIDGDHALIFRDNSNNNTVTVQSPELSSNYTLTLPTGIGSAGDVLTVDASGNLSFTDLTIEVSNQTADTTTYYPLLSTSNSGSISSVDTSSSKLSFQPSSGKLTVDACDISTNLDVTSNITAGGNITANGDITSTSDIRLKNDISTITDAVKKVTSFRGISFTKINSGKKSIGLIAQEVEQIVPELVTADKDGIKSIAYSNIVALLVEAIKEQESRLSKLEDK